jgi:[protein-PII] uridylyltransferase
LLRQQLVGALEGEVDVSATLEQRDREPPRDPVREAPTAIPAHHSTAPPRIAWFDGTSGTLIIEIRATDRAGLLARLAGALERAGVDVVWAKVTTRGSMVDDVFCVVPPSGASEATSDVRAAIERDLFVVLGAAAPA